MVRSISACIWARVRESTVAREYVGLYGWTRCSCALGCYSSAYEGMGLEAAFVCGGDTSCVLSAMKRKAIGTQRENASRHLRRTWIHQHLGQCLTRLQPTDRSINRRMTVRGCRTLQTVSTVH